jgi:hypothetical protein
LGGKHPRATAKEIGIGFRNTAYSLASHRMAAQKRAAMQGAPRLLDDYPLRASGIGYECVGPDEGIEFSKSFENARDRLRQKQQIADAGRFFESDAPIDSSSFDALTDAAFGADSEDGAWKFGSAQREPERASDQADTDDANGLHLIAAIN